MKSTKNERWIRFAELKIDTRKLEPYEAFERTTADVPKPDRSQNNAGSTC